MTIEEAREVLFALAEDGLANALSVEEAVRTIARDEFDQMAEDLFVTEDGRIGRRA